MSRWTPAFNDEQEAAIVRRYTSDDETIAAIAETLGVTRPTIRRVLDKHGVKTRHHLHALTPSQEEEVIRRFTEGETGRDLAVIFGLDQKTITSIVKRRGGPLRRPGRRRHFDSREQWLAHPPVRLRKLLATAKGNGRDKGFDEALFDVLPMNPPKTCACCGVELDYTVYGRTDERRDRSPSLDRCDNALGYIVGNIYVVCWRCNRLKNDATIDELEMLAAYAKRHRARGGAPQRPFPYPPELSIEDAVVEVERLRAVVVQLDEGEIRPRSLAGLSVCRPFFPNRYRAKWRGEMSAFDAWHSDAEYQKAVEFQIEHGDPVTPERVLRAITLRCRTPTIFRPVVARFICERYCPPSGRVWDPCAGFGGRLLGAEAARIHYVGTDVDEETVTGNQRLATLINSSAEVVLCPAEQFDPGSVDLVFTSPPYVGREHYSNAENQAWKKYGSLPEWTDGFLRPIVTRAWASLGPGQCLVLNVADIRERKTVIPLVSQTIDAAVETGFAHLETLLMPIASINRIAASEPILVFQKPR